MNDNICRITCYKLTMANLKDPLSEYLTFFVYKQLLPTLYNARIHQFYPKYTEIGLQ